MKGIKYESEALGLLMIDEDLFTYDTPLGMILIKFNQLSGMDDNLFTYEEKIPKLPYLPNFEQLMNNLDDGNPDVYERKVCYDEKKTVKRSKGIAENVLVRIDKFLFPVDFIVLDIPEDIKTPLILGRPFLSTTHAKIDVFKRKITLKVGNDKVVFKSDKPTSNIIKRFYVLNLLYGDDIELNDLNEPLELRRNQVDDLGPTIEEGEIVDEPIGDVVKTRHDNKIIDGLDEYPSYYDFDRKIHISYAFNLQFSCMIGYEHVNANFFHLLSINVMSKSFYNSIMKDKVEYKGKNVVGAFMNVPIFVGNFSVVTDFAVMENMDAYRDEGMGDIIAGRPFCREACVKERRYDGMITIYNENDSVTYQMARSHPRFKHLTNAQCNKMRPLLKVSAQDELKGISYPYQKLKGFYKGVLNLGLKHIKNEKVDEWLTRGDVSVHEIRSQYGVSWFWDTAYRLPV
ncbi:homeodomain-like protein [Tanacetum coccineum]